MASARQLIGLGLLLAASGCVPAGVFSTARTLGAGEIEHTAFVDVPVAQYGAPQLPDPDDRELPPRLSRWQGGPHFGYGLTVGLHRHVDTGFKLTVDGGELNAKIGIVEGDAVSLALAPRLATFWGFLTDLPLYNARLPVLLTLEPTRWLAFTPRLGLGVVRGRVGPNLDSFVDDDERGTLFFSDPFVEGGLGVLFQIDRQVGFALEGYRLQSIDDRTSGRSFETWGGGFAFLIGRASRASVRAR